MCRKLTYPICVVLLLIPVTHARAYLISDPELTLYYSFDEVTDIVLDQSVNGHDGIIHGDVTLYPEGIHNGAAIVMQVLAGANVVQIASALYKHGKRIIKDMLSDINSWMDEKGFKKLNDFRGKMSQDKAQNPAAYE